MGSATYKYNPSTVEDVYRDFKGRRAGMIKALTVGTILLDLFHYLLDIVRFFLTLVFRGAVADVEDFFKQCDPG